MPRQPKCFVCRLRPPDDGKELCGICVGHVQTFVQGRLEHLGFLVRLYCGWSKCRTEFYSPRWRDPAYHTATCKQMAYYERKKAGTTAAKPALARRLRPVRDSRRVSAPSPQMCELCGRYPPYQKGGQLCQPCHVTTERYIRSHLDDLGHVVMVTCAREQCRSEFITARWRDPAYCSDRCRTSQFKDRQKDKQAATESEGTIW